MSDAPSISPAIYIYIFLGLSILHYSIGQQKRFQILWLQNQPSWFHRQFPVKFGTLIGVELLFLDDKVQPHILKPINLFPLIAIDMN